VGFFSNIDLRLDTEEGAYSSTFAALGAATVDLLIGIGFSTGFFSNMALRLATLFVGAIKFRS
jgi:hypothetical protein